MNEHGQKCDHLRPQTLDLLVLGPAMGLPRRSQGDGKIKKDLKLSSYFLSRALELKTRSEKSNKESNTQFSLNLCTIIV